MTTPLRSVYQIKILLKGSKPPIWRRFLVENNISLADLHLVLQIVMGWSNSHLHQYIANGQLYGIDDPEFDFGFTEILDENKYRLKQLLKKEKDKILYEYDFGDGWEHDLILEKILPFDPKTTLPRCIKATGACPPEDVGGIWGYYDFLDAIQDPNHPEHDDFLQWIGEDEFDPKAYDLKETNKLLLEYC